jgi:acyl-CoA synthetase (NDP forming)
VVTTTGGGATMVVDPLSTQGVNVAQPSDETLARFKAAGIDVKPARIVDVTLAGARYDVMKAALDILNTAPEYDLILPIIGSSARFHPELAVKPIVDSAGAQKPLAACLVPDAPAALAMLSDAGVPCFRTPEACADAIAAALRRRAPRAMPEPIERPIAGDARMLDEFDAGTLMERYGIPRAPTVVIDVAKTKRAPTLPFPYPVVVKALSADIAHKTEAGGVVLNVADGDALLNAIKRIQANVAKAMPHASVSRVLVQPMVSGIGEALIGYRVDPAVGPLVMVASGGILTEIYRDRALRLAPVDLATAHDMIDEVRAFAALKGFRGRPKADLDALANAIVAMSRLSEKLSIVEAEVNPLIVRADGVLAVDALVKLV